MERTSTLADLTLCITALMATTLRAALPGLLGRTTRGQVAALASDWLLLSFERRLLLCL